MATVETLTVELADGGTITLTIEADFLAMCIEDFSLVKELAELVRNVGGSSPSPPPAGVVEFVRDEPVGSPKAKQRHVKPRKRAAPGESKYDYAEVARIATAAQRAGEPMARALAQRFGVGEAMGTYLVGAARKHGHEIPKASTGARAKPKTAKGAPLAAVADIETVNHPASGPRSFTPADTLKLLQGG